MHSKSPRYLSGVSPEFLPGINATNVAGLGTYGGLRRDGNRVPFGYELKWDEK
jgi:hypothetical protein